MTDLLERLRSTREVRIVTESARGEQHRTIIWVVVDARDRILARSYRGSGARWYREAMSGRPAALQIGSAIVPMRIEPAVDADRIAACSAALEEKYAGDPATPAMVRDEVLGTTVQLVPR
jgi:hypothetical protein